MPFKAITIKELMDKKFPEYWEEDDWGISYIGKPYSKGNGYDIEWSRCKDYRDMLAWSHQLVGKNWCTNAVLYEFYTKVRRHNKLEYPQI